jgi:hypothetical protein
MLGKIVATIFPLAKIFNQGYKNLTKYNQKSLFEAD